MTSAHAIIGHIFPIIVILCVFEKQPGGPCLNLRAADHYTKILGDKANIKNTRDAYVDCIRADTVSIRALLFELLAAVAPGGWGVGCGIATALEAGGWDQRRQRDAAAVAQGGWRWRWRRS
jgi:hypothetical protein